MKLDIVTSDNGLSRRVPFLAAHVPWLATSYARKSRAAKLTENPQLINVKAQERNSSLASLVLGCPMCGERSGGKSPMEMFYLFQGSASLT
jgi:hypothetical protein